MRHLDQARLPRGLTTLISLGGVLAALSAGCADGTPAGDARRDVRTDAADAADDLTRDTYDDTDDLARDTDDLARDTDDLARDTDDAPDTATDTAVDSRDETADTAQDVADTGGGDTDGATDPSSAVFDVAVIHRYELELAPEDWAAIRDDPWGAGKTYRRARFSFDGEMLEDVGVRAFGYGSLVAGKPSLKIAFDRYVDQEFRGLEQLKLDNSAQDPSFLRERIGNAILRRWGVPAPRTGWASVDVNGEPVGFFVALEPVDDVFLRRWFGNDDGALWGTNQGAWGQGLTPMHDPFVYYGLETRVRSDGSHLVALTQLIADGPFEDVAAAIDVEGFLRESLARSAFGSVDALSSDANNYYLYEDDPLLRVIPWDLDFDFGNAGLGVALAVDPRAPWRSSPWASDSLTGEPYTDVLLQRILETGVDIEPLLVDLVSGAMAPDLVDAEVAASAALIRPEMDADPLGDPAVFDGAVDLLRLFIERRTAQLSGTEVPCGPPPPAGDLGAADLAITGSVGWGGLMIDGTTLGPGFDVGGVHYCTGVFAHAPSAVQVTIPEGCTGLSAAVGLQQYDEACSDGAVFRVRQDGVALWESRPHLNNEPAEAFGPLAITPGTLDLEVDPLDNNACDTAAWLDLMVHCAP